MPQQAADVKASEYKGPGSKDCEAVGSGAGGEGMRESQKMNRAQTLEVALKG